MGKLDGFFKRSHFWRVRAGLAFASGHRQGRWRQNDDCAELTDDEKENDV